jgi:hypothetical protein
LLAKKLKSSSHQAKNNFNLIEMLKAKFVVITCLVAISLQLYSFNIQSQTISLNPKKKLIDFGWNSPKIDDYFKDISKFENKYFEGITLKLPVGAGAGNIFMVNDLRKLTSDSLEIIEKLAPKIKQSSQLTDNFLVLYGASQLDWFSDEDWSEVEKSIRYSTRIAKAAGCKGILWDPEPYKPGKNPWRFKELVLENKKSYQEYASQIRKRGVQFIKAIQEEYPGVTVLSLRGFSDYQKGSPFSEPLLPVVNVAETEKKIAESWGGLNIFFTVGILDGIAENVRFIDANEEAYYYTSALEFYEAKNTVNNEGRALVPEELHKKYASNFQFGNAISVDYTNGNWVDAIFFPFRLKGQALMLSPKQRALWFEHNAYYSLKTADEYAWLYTESTNMWNGKDLPLGFGEALLRAKEKVAEGKPLGFSIEQMMRNAQAKAEKFHPEKKNKK